jgi:uncharacterized protein (UPF0332 family)
MARDSLEAARVLLANKHWRSSVSRSYYSAFAAMTAAVESNASFPSGRDAPAHATMPALIRNYLSQLRIVERRRLMSDVRELYENRITADYRVSRTVNRETALRSVLLAERAIKALESNDG